MKAKTSLLLTLLLSVFTFLSCTVSRKTSNSDAVKIQIPGPQVIIYMTKSDYSKLVPIILSPDRKAIISYPDIKDVYSNGKLAYPTPLHKGFYLDNRGISLNVAFLKLTYEEYAALPKTPSQEELEKLILVRKPIKKMYSCGLRSKFSNITEELNTAIDAGDFSKFQRLK